MFTRAVEAERAGAPSPIWGHGDRDLYYPSPEVLRVMRTRLLWDVPNSGSLMDWMIQFALHFSQYGVSAMEPRRPDLDLEILMPYSMAAYCLLNILRAGIKINLEPHSLISYEYLDSTAIPAEALTALH